MTSGVNDRMWAALLVATAAAAAAAVLPGVYSQAQMPSSPCPDVFQYAQGNDGVWRAQLWAWPPQRGQPIRLRVELFLESALPNKYAGRILLVEDKDVVAQKLLAGSREQIKYTVLFPLLYPLPLVDRIVVNENIICMGPRVSSSVLTRIGLEHTLYPTVTPLNSGVNNILPGNVLPGTQPGRPDIDFPWPDWSESKPQPQPQPQQPWSQRPRPQPQPQPPFQPRPQQPNESELPINPPMEIQPIRPKPKPSTSGETRPPFRETSTQKPMQNDLSNSEICGRSVSAIELIVNGRDTSRGEWPWISALFLSADIGNLEFQCSGTLFNRRHVITAAHCVRPRDQPEVEAHQLVVYLGLHNLRRLADAHSQPREVGKIFVHPDYAATTSFDADMAVLRLTLPAEYTPYVRPICLWQGSEKLDNVVGMLGTVIGWGRDESGNRATNEPRQTELPIVSQEECLLSQTDFISITSKRTFCAGFRNDTGPCNGDSGSGLFMRFRDGNVLHWYLRGITSVSLYDRQQNRCDLKNYVVFTDMAKFGSWMQQFMRNEYL